MILANLKRFKTEDSQLYFVSYISQDEKYLPITNATQNPSNELSLWVAITVIDLILYKGAMGGKGGLQLILHVM